MKNKHKIRRIQSWFRSPLYYAVKAKRKLMGGGLDFKNRTRDAYPDGSLEWLALTEIGYGGYQSSGVASKIDRGGDRMSPEYHDYGYAYAEFLKKYLGRKSQLKLLEVGILNGNGLATWCDLFPSADIYGMDIDLSNCKLNERHLKELGAFSKNSPQLHEFDQLDIAKAKKVMLDVFGDDKLDIVIDDGCHSMESIEITFEAVKPYLADVFVYFIEDNYDSYDVMSKKYPEYKWTTRGEITIAVNR